MSAQIDYLGVLLGTIVITALALTFALYVIYSNRRELVERKRAEEELRELSEQLRSLSAHLQSVSEKERSTIAREIHDELDKALTALQIDLYWLGERVPVGKEDLIQKINSMSDAVEKIIQSTQRISIELSPVDEGVVIT